MKQFYTQLKIPFMKKILTLLLSMGIFSASFAQGNSHHDSRNDQYASNGRYDNDHYNNNSRDYYKNERAAAIQRINSEYTYKVQAIENNRYMRKNQKKQALRDAKNERANKIKMLNSSYQDRSRYNYGNYTKGRN